MNIPVSKLETNLVPPKKVGETQQQNGVSQAQERQQEEYNNVSPIELAYLMIYESVISSHDTAQIQAKELENNAQNQNLLINEEEQFNFFSLPSDRVKWKYHKSVNAALPDGGNIRHSGFWTKKVIKVGTKTIAKYQVKNQEISAIRDNFSNKLIVDRQDAQINETNMNSTINTSEQSISEGSGIMQMLNSLTNQIAKV
ncbi:MAG: hypothetical protein K940chlam9_01419 [Chlamydiae bacterium]|nr:hypothetical protein [Chlamydiota bacterium]